MKAKKPTRRKAPSRRAPFARAGLLAVALSAALFAVSSFGGSVAYLSSKSNTVTNTFEMAEITYSLTLMPNLPGESLDEPVMPTVTPGTNSSNSQSATQRVVAGEAGFELDRTPTLKGYVFTGWFYDEECTILYDDGSDRVITVSYGDGGTSADSVEVVLYAKWEAGSYAIAYHANGGNGSMVTQMVEYNKLTALSENLFTRDDHRFAGWALSADGGVKYADKQEVVNLLESGTLDLYAVWTQESHTVTFDYNGGRGTVDSIQVQKGNPYGALPTYPTHDVKVISEDEIMTYLFAGWYTALEGGERVLPTDIVSRAEDHTLYAHWKEAPSNNVIKDIAVRSNPDDNSDGVADAVAVNLKCSSYFEKYNIPLENLVVGQRYRLSFTESNNATYGTNPSGYQKAIYGFIITKDRTLSPGTIREESIADGGLVAVFDDQNDPSKGLAYLNGPRNWEVTFSAEAETMYWTWDYGLIQDGTPYDFNYTNIKLVPVEPEIEFGGKKLILYSTSAAQVLNDSSSPYATNFVFDGDGYAETMYYPITGLTAGSTYTITFGHKIAGALINSDTYDYGCGISSVIPTAFGSKMDNLGATWISAKPVFTQLDTTELVTLTFTATGDTAYWVWNMANCSDSTNCSIDVKLTNFSATHQNGGSITYFTAPSQALLSEAIEEGDEDA